MSDASSTCVGRAAFMLVATTLGCSAPPECVVPTAQTTNYTVGAITLPQQRIDFARDLNGDGRLDNQLGNLVGAFMGGGIDIQAAVSIVLADGRFADQVAVFSDSSTSSVGLNLSGQVGSTLCAS